MQSDSRIHLGQRVMNATGSDRKAAKSTEKKAKPRSLAAVERVAVVRQKRERR